MLPPLAWARQAHTATLLPSGKVLIAGGEGASGTLTRAELYDPATGAWAPTGSLAQARRDHTAILLPSGKVLVVGGHGTSATLASAELYDPATGTWGATSSLPLALHQHTATLLSSGKVLVVGGYGTSGSLATAMLYDPATNAWAATGSLSEARGSHTATLLPSGRVLVTGGKGSDSYLPSAEVYDPATGVWTATGSLAQARRSHTATLLPSGKVLVTGGKGFNNATVSTELYDPAAGAWTPTGSLSEARESHTATLLPSGRVLVTGGEGPGSLPLHAEFYDSDTGAWTSSVSLSEARAFHTATLLPSGKVMMVGGSGASGVLASAELYDPAPGFWTPTAPLPWGRYGHRASLLHSGKVLVVGGASTGFLTDAALYDPDTGVWTVTGSLTQGRLFHTMTLLPSGKVLVASGYGTGGTMASAELYDPVSGSWTVTGSLAQRREEATATLLPSGKVLVVGGRSQYPDGQLASAEVYDPATGAWTATGSLAQARDGHTATLLPSGKVLVTGGYAGSPLASAELYDPVTGTWSATGSLVQARYLHTATLLPSGKVLVASGADGPIISSAEVYDPATGAWTATGSLAQARIGHTATLLPSGKVLVASGGDFGSDGSVSSEMYDPATGSWTDAGRLNRYRRHHTATLLPSGRVLVTGGYLFEAGAELYDDTGADPSWRPGIVSVSSDPVVPGNVFTVNGSLLRGISEASDGSGHSSPTNFPFLTLLDLARERLVVLPPRDFSSTHVTARLPAILTGQYLLSVTVNGLTTSKPLAISTDPASPDYTPPAVTLTAPVAGATVSGNVTLTATATDNVRVTLVEFYEGSTLLGTDTSWPYSLNWDTRTGANGERTLTAKAHDAAGNTGFAQVKVTANNDFTAPTVTLTAPGAGATLSGTVTLSATASDDRAVTKVAFFVGSTQVGSDTAAPFSFNYNTRSEANGAQVITAMAYDAANNVGASAPVNVTFDNDFTPPSVTLTTPGEGETLTGTVVFTATASDDRALTRVAFFVGTTQVGTDNTAPFSFSYNTRSQANGAKVLTAKAYDAVNNVGTSAPVNVTFDNDFTPPSVTLTAPGEGETLTGTVVLTATASDAAGIARVAFFVGTTQVGSDTTAPFSFSYNTRSQANGAKVLTAKAYDTLNNVGTSAPVNVTFDNDLTPPTTSIASPTSGATLSGVVQIDAIASDDRGTLTKVEFFQGSTLLGTDTTAPYSWTWDTTKAPIGNHTLKTRAWDAAGNSAYSANVTVTVTRP
ncbi:MAG TPA: kelch repeat-containing protein [Myxococcaceae bacterium]